MNFEKYRKADTIKLHGIYGDIYQESENGELIDSMRSKDADWLTGKSVFAKSESFDFEKFVLQELNQHFINKLFAIRIFLFINRKMQKEWKIRKANISCLMQLLLVLTAST